MQQAAQASLAVPLYCRTALSAPAPAAGTAVASPIKGSEIAARCRPTPTAHIYRHFVGRGMDKRANRERGDSQIELDFRLIRPQPCRNLHGVLD